LSPQWERLAEPVKRASFPVGLHNAFLFSTFNGLSYQIMLNSPMVLYAKGLGASATVLGIIAGMMPLLVIFQIPAANYIPRLGFKRFVYAGWGDVHLCYGVGAFDGGVSRCEKPLGTAAVAALLF
jgi:hypothetical protein